MWFRRKGTNNGDDTELGDPQRSLKDSPGADRTHAGDEPSVKSGTPPRAGKPDTRGEIVSPFKRDNKNISNAVASDEHMDWDFNVDLAADELSRETPYFEPLESVEFEYLSVPEIPRISKVISIHGERDAAAGPIAGPADSGTADNIPVLNNIVYLPERDKTEPVDTRISKQESPFVEQCLKDISKRLKRNELTPLTPAQEQRLRTTITSLLVQKASGKFEQ